MKSHFEILHHLLTEKAVAIVRLDGGKHLVTVAEVLKTGGITVIEFTFSTPGALDMLKKRLPISATMFPCAQALFSPLKQCVRQF